MDEIRIKVYPVEGGFVVADQAGWVPGVFPSEEAAYLAAEAANGYAHQRDQASGTCGDCGAMKGEAHYRIKQ